MLCRIGLFQAHSLRHEQVDRKPMRACCCAIHWRVLLWAAAFFLFQFPVDGLLAQQPDPIAPLIELANSGKSKKAVKALEALESDSAWRLEARAVKANILLVQLDDAESGMAILQENLVEAPQHFSSLEVRGRYYLEILEIARAEADFRSLVRAAGTSDSLLSKAYLALGNTLVMQQRFEEALETYRLGLEVDSGAPGHRMGMANALGDLGRDEEAIQILESVREELPDQMEVMNNLGFLYMGVERYEEAAAAFDRIIALDPEAAFSWSNRAYAKLQLGDPDAALEDIQQSIKLMPSNSWAHRNLGLIRQAMGQPDAACDAWRDARSWGFERMYGPEVEKLIRENCR